MKCIATVILFCCLGTSAWSNVYVMIYATQNGRSGHVSIAVDNYDIIVTDTIIEGKTIYLEDTLSNGSITFYDLWPDKEDMKIWDYNRKVKAAYQKFPEAGKRLTISDLYDKGIPNQPLKIAFDGLLLLSTTVKEDQSLKEFLDNQREAQKPFHARNNNCTDFIVKALEFLLSKKIRAKEFIPFRFSSTPNKLYRKIKDEKRITVVINPGKTIEGSFFKERILKARKRRKFLTTIT